jgi:hypothetical protein
MSCHKIILEALGDSELQNVTCHHIKHKEDSVESCHASVQNFKTPLEIDKEYDCVVNINLLKNKRSALYTMSYFVSPHKQYWDTSVHEGAFQCMFMYIFIYICMLKPTKLRSIFSTSISKNHNKIPPL